MCVERFVTVIAVCNIKGGVGKTSSAINLAWLAASEGSKSLVWDLDPAGGATYCLKVKPRIKGGLDKLFGKKGLAQKAVQSSGYEGLDVLPADHTYRALERNRKRGKKHGLGRVLKPLRQSYDYIFIDCPPGMTPVTQSVFDVSNVVLVPTTPSTLSMRLLDQLTDVIGEQKSNPPRVLTFFNMVNQRRRLHREVIQASQEQQTNMLDTTIPISTDVEQMGARRAVLAEFAPRSRAMSQYRQLWLEIRPHLQLE